MAGTQCKFVVLVFKLRLVSWDNDTLRIPATAYAQTLPASHKDRKIDFNMKTETIDKQTVQKRNWITHPTKRNLLIIVTVWVVGNGLLIISTTDLFTESFLDKKYILIYAMMIMSSWTTFKVISNYFKTRVTDDKK